MNTGVGPGSQKEKELSELIRKIMRGLEVPESGYTYQRKDNSMLRYQPPDHVSAVFEFEGKRYLLSLERHEDRGNW